MVSTTTTNYSEDEETCCEHAKPSIRTCKIERTLPNGSCGFHLTRTKWDPYPWIAGVEKDTPAELAGLKVGDCVLEVNGDDIIGLKVSDIAKKVLTDRDVISLLLWNAGNDSSCDQESVCCAPMPTSLSRLSNCLNSILSSLECPVCFEVIPPPAHQCPLGHIICFRCHAYTEKCPVCRTRFNKDRNIVADKVYDSLIDAFQLRSQPVEVHSRKLWDRLFNRKKRDEQQQKIETNNNNNNTNSNNGHHNSNKSINFRPFDIKNRFLSRLTGKATSVDNLGPSSNLLKMNDIYPPYGRKKSLSTNELFRPSRTSGAEDAAGSSSSLSLYGQQNNNHNHNHNHNNNNDHHHHSHQLIVSYIASSSSSSTNRRRSTVLFKCPCDERCTKLSAAEDIMQHIQYAHNEGPVLHYCRNEFVLDFPLSFPDDLTIIVLSCYDRTFFVKILQEHIIDGSGEEIKVHIWSLTSAVEASNYKVIGTLSKSGGEDQNTELTFKTFVHPLEDEEDESMSTASSGVTYKDQIVITKGLIDAYFVQKVFSLSVAIISIT